jgi:hypothetical protein
MIIIINLIKFRKIKASFLKEIDVYEERILDEESRSKNAEAKMKSYIHLKEDLHLEDFPENEVKITSHKDLYNGITKLINKENRKLLRKINRNIFFITKGDSLFNNEINNESEILLSLSNLDVSYQNFYLGKSNPKLEKLITLAFRYRENYFIINNDLEKATKDIDVKKIKKLLSLWSSQKYILAVNTILNKKHFINKADKPKIIAIMSDIALKKLKNINPKIIEEFQKKEIYLQNISNLAQFIEKGESNTSNI